MSASDARFMRLALRLARRGYGSTSPNPMVGAVLVKGGKIIGRGWHRRAGLPHAEIEALRDAQKRGYNPKGSTLYVTLEPCSTHGRTPPCTDAIIAAGIKRVVIGTTDPNPKHSGRASKILRRAGIEVDWWGERPREPDNQSKRGSSGASPHQDLAEECGRLNEAFNHWIVHHTPFVTVKAAMTLDGKIATASGESKWITGERARNYGMKLRQGADAILVGINTILADDPTLTVRKPMADDRRQTGKPIRRIVLDSLARTPLKSKVVSDEFAALTTIVVSKRAPKNRVTALAKRVRVMVVPTIKVGRAVLCPPSSARSENAPYHIDLRWLLKKLGSENVTSLLVEGGGEVNASFLLGGLAQRVAFFYAPKILGGRDSRKAVGGEGARSLVEALQLHKVEWKKIGEDLLMTARVA
ncbi:MAG TPA: bifunctional diaminohydroxyphosphoribosylaminopyrimidine deaminase/5-amino-6-(5-phosphoribosylamino)uracil reductase RibD [Candidatus Saccharimonadales bacterium]|nr:bifunctional diaminohydroxyphosphoribosylaminopyrimidine deaminase/5-amino-6-(5-phosphoribosylamino)uracil reductase RibD [Candidatus Saccharimonadales bacterium]